MNEVIALRNIGNLSARLIKEGRNEFVELYVRLPASSRLPRKKPKRLRAKKKARNR